MVKGYEFYNSDGCTCCGMQEHESHMDLGADYVLASDYDALESRLAEVRMNTGCARGQRSTQFCAEVVVREAERDALQRKLESVIAMLEPETPDDNGNRPFFCESCLWTGFDVVLAGDRPEDEYCSCPVCGGGVNGITAWDREFLGRVHARVRAIVEGES